MRERVYPGLDPGQGEGSSMTKDTMCLGRGQIEVMDKVMAAVLREKTPAERLRIGFRFWVSTQN